MPGANDQAPETPTENSTAASASDWRFCSIAELTRAMRSRRLSVSELLEDVVARIEALEECDVVLYPSAAVPVPHDHSEPIEDRHLDIEGKAYPYYDACFIWADPASTCGLPATAEIDRSATGLPIEVQIIGPYLEDYTTLAFAELLEREFGGFVPHSVGPIATF